nr:elicitin-like protein [Pythium porphyrae]
MHIVVPLALAACGLAGTYALPCSRQHLGVFNEATVAAAINKCQSSSEIKLSMPPTQPLTSSQQEQICDERECKDMIAAIDDMEVPRCDLQVNGKNMTLQMTLDRFTTICDVPRTVAPMKKKKRGIDESSAGSSLHALSIVTFAVAVVTAFAMQ